MDYIIKDGELQHHGILGQKWGVRRFQNKDGSLTQAGKKRITRKQKKALEKARQAKRDKAEAAKKAKQEQEDFEKNKKKALESGSAADVAKFKGKLTNEELQRVVSRLNMEQRISELADKKEPSKIEKMTSKMEKVNNFVDKGITGWNNIAKILNSTTGTDLPMIKEGGKPANKAKKAAEKIVEEASKIADDANKDYQKKAEKQAAKEAKREAKKEANKEAEREHYTVNPEDVFGEGTSRRKSKSSNKTKRNDDVIWLTEDDYTVKTVSDVPQQTIDRGRSYASGLLNNPVYGLLPAPKDRDR